MNNQYYWEHLEEPGVTLNFKNALITIVKAVATFAVTMGALGGFIALAL